MLKSAGIGAAMLLQLTFAADDGHDQYSRTLKFRADDSFKIVTFSDLGLSDNSEDYLQTQGLIETVLNTESPDLVVLTGDIVAPDHADDYGYHFSSALELIKERNVPWIWTGGNKIEQQSNSDLHEIDYSFGRDLSWTGYVWDMHVMGTHGKTYEQENLGYFTARIPVMDASGKEEIFSVYTLDSSSTECQEYGLPGESCITTDAIDWFNDQQHLYSHKSDLRDFIFLHKPVPEFMNLANLYEISGHKEQAISCHAVNTGLFASGVESKKVVWMNAGYDANNDFSGRYHSEMMFSYARKSGYGGDGSLPRGVRAFRLTLNQHKALHGLSYIIEGDTGEKSTDMHKQKPPNFGFSLQTQCSVDPFATMFETVMHPDYTDTSSGTDDTEIIQ